MFRPSTRLKKGVEVNIEQITVFAAAVNELVSRLLATYTHHDFWARLSQLPGRQRAAQVLRSISALVASTSGYVQSQRMPSSSKLLAKFATKAQ